MSKKSNAKKQAVAQIVHEASPTPKAPVSTVSFMAFRNEQLKAKLNAQRAKREAAERAEREAIEAEAAKREAAKAEFEAEQTAVDLYFKQELRTLRERCNARVEAARAKYREVVPVTRGRPAGTTPRQPRTASASGDRAAYLDVKLPPNGKLCAHECKAREGSKTATVYAVVVANPNASIAEVKKLAVDSTAQAASTVHANIQRLVNNGSLSVVAA